MMERRRSDNAKDWLAFFYTMGYLLMVGALFFVDIPTGNRELMLTLGGIMSTVQAAIIGYYFGASKTTETLARSMPPAPVSTDSMAVQADTVQVTEERKP